MDISHDHTDFGPQIPFWALKAYFRLFNHQKYVFSCSMLNSRSMDISHDHTFGAYFCLFDPWKYIFSSSLCNYRSTDGSNDLYHFWTLQCPVFIKFRISCPVRHFFEDLLGLMCYENIQTIPNMFGGAPSPSKTPTKTESVFILYFTFSSNWTK
jgi:hypothetical protein